MASATLTANLTATVGSASLPSGSVTVSATLAGTDLGSATQQVGTSFELLDVPADISWPAHLMIVNQSASATLTIAVDVSGTYKMGVIPPGGVFLSSGVAAKPYVKFDVADQLVWRAVEA